MFKTTVRVIARIVSLSDKIEEVKSILTTLTELTRQENGCIVYDVLQNKNDPTDFTTVEEWANQASLDIHLSSTHLKQAQEQLKTLITLEPSIGFYQLLA